MNVKLVPCTGNSMTIPGVRCMGVSYGRVLLSFYTEEAAQFVAEHMKDSNLPRVSVQDCEIVLDPLRLVWDDLQYTYILVENVKE